MLHAGWRDRPVAAARQGQTASYQPLVPLHTERYFRLDAATSIFLKRLLKNKTAFKIVSVETRNSRVFSHIACYLERKRRVCFSRCGEYPAFPLSLYICGARLITVLTVVILCADLYWLHRELYETIFFTKEYINYTAVVI